MSYTLNVEIEPAQLEFLAKNRFKMALAKVVNKTSTIVWNSADMMLKNQFKWSENYTVWASAKYEAGIQVEQLTNSVPIQFGQTAIIDAAGVIQKASGPISGNSFKIRNNYMPVYIGVSCDLTAPGKPSGMAPTPCYVSPYMTLYKGVNTLTPIEKVQVWFDHMVISESMIDADEDLGIMVDFTAEKAQTISYVSRDPENPNLGGEWREGPLNSK